jgi:hypothetical protein
MGFHRILCPVDFSDTSAEAARYAASLAGRHSAELTLLHVAPPIGLDYALIEPTQNRLREIASHRNQIAWQAFESFPPSRHSPSRPSENWWKARPPKRSSASRAWADTT